MTIKVWNIRILISLIKRYYKLIFFIITTVEYESLRNKMSIISNGVGYDSSASTWVVATEDLVLWLMWYAGAVKTSCM